MKSSLSEKIMFLVLLAFDVLKANYYHTNEPFLTALLEKFFIIILNNKVFKKEPTKKVI